MKESERCKNKCKNLKNIIKSSLLMLKRDRWSFNKLYQPNTINMKPLSDKISITNKLSEAKN